MHVEDLEPGVWQEHIAGISRLLAEQFADRSSIDILEAGCGSGSWLTFPPQAHLVGIDISSEQLTRNMRVHERIQGDLQTFEYGGDRFDAIVCWDVLEHLDRPAAAIDRFARALRPGGLLILGFPDRRSLKGRLTRLLPYRTHVWLYRWVLRVRDAGTGDRGPFPTPMKRDMDPRAIVTRMRDAGLHAIVDASYESPMMMAVRRRFHLRGRRWKAMSGLTRVLSVGHVDPRTTDCVLVFSKPPADRR
jgi:SAM-dependent methyltransferase